MQIATRLTLFSLIFAFTLSTIHAEGSATVEGVKIVEKFAKEAATDLSRTQLHKPTFTGSVTINVTSPATVKSTQGDLPALAQLIQQKIAEYKQLISEHKIAAALIVAGVIVFMISVFRFNCKEPRKDCVNRYSLSFKDLKLRSIEDVHGLQEQIRYILRNTHYIIEDGIIGRPGNSSAAIRVDPETGKVSAKEFCPSQGLYGWIHGYLKPITNTLKFPFEAGKVIATVGAGVYILANPDILAKLIATTATQPKL
jgi:hypothetical protein